MLYLLHYPTRVTQISALTTATIVPSVMSPTCMDYRVVGVCYWLYCTPFGCKVKTSPKVGHYVPDAVVSSYGNTGQSPWIEVAAMSSPTSEAQGGGSGTTNNVHENNLATFKNVDVIGHPGLVAFKSFASDSGYVCAGAGASYVPNISNRKSTGRRLRLGALASLQLLQTRRPDLPWQHRHLLKLKLMRPGMDRFSSTFLSGYIALL
jgi:hypothetical protein